VSRFRRRSARPVPNDTTTGTPGPGATPVTIGLSTYAFFWRRSERVSRPLDLLAVIERTAAAGAGVLQICDLPGLERLSATELAALRAASEQAGVALEVGFRGVRSASLERFLDIAVALRARLVRTMLGAGADRPTVQEAVRELRAVAPRYADAGVRIGLETYEVFATSDLLRVVTGVGDPGIGVCLDPANTVARLEQPHATIDQVAEHVVNLHVKDFTFTRSPGLVGFALTGCELGTGLLDLGYLYDRVRPSERGISEIVEHWLPWQGDEVTTVETEERWTERSLAVMRGLAG